MLYRIRIITFMFGTLSALFFGFFVYAQTSSFDDLKSSINVKNEEIKKIREEQLRVQKDIEESIGEQQSLTKELQRISYNVKQLDLGTRASEITLEKLALEIQDTQERIVRAQEKIERNKTTIADILKSIYQNDVEPFLILILRHKTLSESFNEVQSLNMLAAELTIALDELGAHREELEQSLLVNRQKEKEEVQEHQTLKVQKGLLGSQQQYKKEILVRTKNQEKGYRSMLSELERQQEAISQEIETLEEELRKQIDATLLPSARPGVLAWPAVGRTTQGYGATTFARYHYSSRWHNGIDIAGPIGTVITAAEDGKVIEAWDQDKYCWKGAYGKFIVVEHNNNLTTLYAHLSAFLPTLKPGDIVKRGDPIGYMGASGQSTGPHVHFTVYSTPTFRIAPSKLSCGPKMPYGGDLNPMSYL